jgi:cytochrome b561
MRESRECDGSRAPFDPVTIFFHWLTASLVGVQMMTGFAMAMRPELISPLLLAHRSGGAIVFLATLLRLSWRQSLARFPPFPARMPRVLQWFATKSEHLLYALLVLHPLTGFSASVLRGRPFQILAFQVPALLPPNIDLWLAIQTAHRIGAFALLGLAGGHSLMALIHHYVLRDDVLEMMAPWLRPRTNRSSTASAVTVAPEISPR